MKTVIEQLIDKVELHEVEPPDKIGNTPYITHEGILYLGEIKIKVCVLNTGQRIIPESEMIKIFGEDIVKELR